MKLYKLLFLITLLSGFTNCSEDRIDGVPMGKIKGIVVMANSNERIPDARISTQPSTSTVFTDANGTFTIDNVPEGTYSVQASKEDLVSAFEAANVLANVTIDLVFDLEGNDGLNQPPSAPTLKSPLNNATDVSTNIDLTWEAIDPDENDNLIFTVSLFNDVNNDVILFENVTDTVVTATNLQFNRKYFWQVEVNDQVNDPVLSEVFTFKTLNPQIGNILFVRAENGNQVIYSLDEDDNTLALTTPDLNSFRPKKNNVSTKIAFLRSTSSGTHLFTMNSDGSNQQQVTNTIPLNGFDFSEIEFAWKPEGDRLIYPSFDKIYSIAIDGTGLQEMYQTTNGNFISEIAWSEIGNVIAIKTNDSNGYNVEILILDTDGNEVETIFSGMTGAAGGLDLNIDGSLVLYSYDTSGLEFSSYRLRDSRLFIYDRISSTADLLRTGSQAGFNALDPKFNPAENEVIYVSQSRNINGIPSIRKHNFNLSDDNFIELLTNAAMPNWED